MEKQNDEKTTPVKEVMTKERKPALAGLMSILPGLGQVYNGQKEKGLFFFACYAFIIYFFSMIIVKQGFIWIKITAVILTVLVLLSILDAFFTAKRLGPVKLKIYNRWYLYIIMAIPWLVILEVPYKLTGFKPLYVVGDSMYPTLNDGEMVVSDKRYYITTFVRDGNIIAFKNPANKDEKYIKRVAGVPEDTIVCTDNQFYVNGVPYKYHYFEYGTGRKDRDRCELAGMFKEEYTVKEKELVVLGDNYYNSEDSRNYGPIDWYSVMSKVNFVLVSEDSDRTGLWLDDFVVTDSKTETKPTSN